jgi:peptidoglycan/LPS O-acetylase OafA/YrhL
MLLLTAALLSVVLSMIVTKLYDEPVRRLLNGPPRFVGRVAAAKA